MSEENLKRIGDELSRLNDLLQKSIETSKEAMEESRRVYTMKPKKKEPWEDLRDNMSEMVNRMISKELNEMNFAGRLSHTHIDRIIHLMYVRENLEKAQSRDKLEEVLRDESELTEKEEEARINRGVIE